MTFLPADLQIAREVVKHIGKATFTDALWVLCSKLRCAPVYAWKLLEATHAKQILN